MCALLNHKFISYELLEFLGLRSYLPPFGQIMQRLAKYGLVETRVSQNRKVTCSFSAVLHQHIRQSIKYPSPLVSKVAGLLAQKVPRSSENDQRRVLDLLGPHAETLMLSLMDKKKIPLPKREDIDNMERIASLLRLRGDDPKAIELYGHCYQLATRFDQKQAEDPITDYTFPRLDPQRLAELYNNMGLSSFNEGNFAFAKTCFGRAENVLREEKLTDSLTIIEVIVNNIWVHLTTEEYQEAYIVAQLSIAEFKPEDIRTKLLLEHASGVVHLEIGKTALGSGILAEALVQALQNPQVGKKCTYSIMHDSAIAYGYLKDWNRAVSLFEKAKVGRERFHGPDHRLTIETVAALAMAYHGAGFPEQAKSSFRRALAWQRDKLPPNHPDTLKTLQNFGIFKHDSGDFEGAMKAHRLAFEGLVEYDNRRGSVSWGRINAGVSLAISLQHLSLFEKSEGLFKEASAWYDSKQISAIQRMTHQYTKTVYLMASMYEDWGDRDQALREYDRAEKLTHQFEDETKNYWKRLASKAVLRLLLEKKREEGQSGQIQDNLIFKVPTLRR
ncbi:hypothetical protein F5Y15DRAFT_28961 [Xylariaceae sp. FL0016]|nr:hypothetical protein F5Y15DRAFT_28961 [Xylariaceae sp. FL0016]